jgi:hypothetical protein
VTINKARTSSGRARAMLITWWMVCFFIVRSRLRQFDSGQRCLHLRRAKQGVKCKGWFGKALSSQFIQGTPCAHDRSSAESPAGQVRVVSL